LSAALWLCWAVGYTHGRSDGAGTTTYPVPDSAPNNPDRFAWPDCVQA
jgi:hypothetical protein